MRQMGVGVGKRTEGNFKYEFTVLNTRQLLNAYAGYFKYLAEQADSFMLSTMIPIAPRASKQKEGASQFLDDAFGKEWGNKFRDILPASGIEDLPRKQLAQKCKESEAFLLNLLDSFNRDTDSFIPRETEQQRITRFGLEAIELICRRFPNVANSLRTRRKGKPPLIVEDEHDVQYLFEALLRQQFDDVRPEEAGPSFAAGAGRLDFLLKEERIGLEAKMTRDGLEAVELRKQALDDIGLYSDHPHFDVLILFVYDPTGRVGNAAGFIADIQGLPSKKRIRVFIER